MSYAGVAEMVARFGETEILRLSVPEDRTAETIDATKVEVALADASATIDGYLRGRYAVPIVDVPNDVVRAACVLARYDLAKGERTEPTEQMRLDRKEAITWLEGIAKGTIRLHAVAESGSPATAQAGGARVSDRPRAFSDRSLRGW